MKTNIKIIIGVTIGILISVVSCYALAENLINSKDVVYEDNSNLVADNVQEAIDGTCSKIDTRLSEIEDKLYTVKNFHDDINITTSTTSTYTGLSVTFPANSYCSVTVRAAFVNSPAKSVFLSSVIPNGASATVAKSEGSGFVSLTYSEYVTVSKTYYIYAQYESVSQNSIRYTGFCATKYK